MLRDWQRIQHENFSHNNWQHIRPVPRTAREAFGENLPAHKNKTLIIDRVIAAISYVVILAYVLSKIL